MIGSTQNIKVNVTLCFSSAQALLAGKLGATYISPFIGRLDDIGTSGLNLIKEIVSIYNNYNKEIKTQVLAASIRSPLQVSQVAIMGAHVATIPPKIITQMNNLNLYCCILWKLRYESLINLFSTRSFYERTQQT